MEQSYTSVRQVSCMERRQACSFRPLHLLLMFVCLSPVISIGQQVEARHSPVDLLLEDFTALLQRVQRQEQVGVSVFQRLQQHLNAFVSAVEDAQRSLWESVARDDARGLEAAVRRGAVVERRNADQMTPLAVASKEGRADTVRALLRLGAAVDSTAGGVDWTPLLWARAYRRTDCETLLLAAGAQQGKVVDPQEVLFEAVSRDDAEGIEAAVHLGADLEAKNGQQMTALGLAAKEGRERAVSTLLRLGAEVEAAAGEKGWSPLLWAVVNRQNQTEALLRKAGAQPQKVGDVQEFFRQAVDRDDAEGIEAAFNLGADLEAKDDEQMTALGLAAREGRARAVSTLLRLGAEVEAAAGWRGWSPLVWAMENRQNQTEALLRKAGAKMKEAQKMLFEAVSRDDAEGIEAAFNLGADLEVKNDEQMTALGLAVKEGRERAASTLLRLAEAEQWVWLPLIWAVANSLNQTEALLGKPGAKMVEAQKLLFEAVGRDDAEGIKAAYRLGADLEAEDDERMTALGLAAKEGRERAVSTLLRLGAEVDAAGWRGWSPLLWALANRQNQTEALLRKAGAKVTKEEAQDLLWEGVEEDDRHKIEGAFRSGADLEESRVDWTPLTKASNEGRLEAVRALVRLGAQLERTVGNWQETALHLACQRGHEAVARLLVEAGASLETKDGDGFTPLHHASANGHLSTVRVLVEAGARLEAETWAGKTPLYFASREGHLPIVCLLVEAGADLNHRGSNRMTPLAVAEFNDHSTLAEYLRSVGATT